MVSKEDFMRIASGLVTTVALFGSTVYSWAQGPGASSSPTPSPTSSDPTTGSALILVVLALVVIGIVVVARRVSARRRRTEEAVILQSQLSDFVLRETQLRGLSITPRARVLGWRKPEVTVEVAGEVPTPDLRDTAMRVVSSEAKRLRPDVTAEDHLFIVPPRTASGTSAKEASLPR
ncbi:MAG TPA: hypothetical protein VFE97_24800 [Methylomirabilota bacterium]|nr:hypothetical protein [Methylomirabilota bacterium]